MREDRQAQLITRGVRHHWRLVAIATVLFTVGAATYAWRRPTSYTSTASVLVVPLLGTAFAPAASQTGLTTTVAMQTEAQLVDSTAVTNRVNAALHTTLESGSPGVSTKVPTDTQLIDISYTDRSPQTAQRLAQAYAVAFLRYRADLAAAVQRAQLDNLNKQASEAEHLLQGALKAAATSKPPPDAASNVQVYSSRLAAVHAQIAQSASVGSQPGSVVTPAKLPRHPGALRSVLIALGGLVLGLIVGIAGAVWRERRDDRIRAADDPSALAVPVLTTMPIAVDATDPARTKPDADQVEAIRAARTGLLAVARAKSVIAVSALSTAKAAAYVVVEIARALTAAGYRVVVVDAAIDGVHVAGLLGVPEAMGLSDALLSGSRAGVELIEVDGLRVLPAGSHPDEARERYSSEQLRGLLDSLSDDADYVLVNASPVGSSDGLAVVLAVDSVVLLATDRLTTHAQVSAARLQVSRLGAELLGIVMIRTRKGRRSRAGTTPTHGDLETLLPLTRAASHSERRARKERLEVSVPASGPDTPDHAEATLRLSVPTPRPRRPAEPRPGSKEQF